MQGGCSHLNRARPKRRRPRETKVPTAYGVLRVLVITGRRRLEPVPFGSFGLCHGDKVLAAAIARRQRKAAKAWSRVGRVSAHCRTLQDPRFLEWHYREMCRKGRSLCHHSSGRLEDWAILGGDEGPSVSPVLIPYRPLLCLHCMVVVGQSR